MKFGTQLKAHRAPHWKYHFVDYDGLKAHLKSKTHEREFTEEDETQFVQLLKAELDKVASFQTMKLGEVQRRTEHCEFTIQQHQMASALTSSTRRSSSSEKLTLSSFVVTESEINKITQDLQDLARFQRLNYTAFLKIIKKHDKHCGFPSLRPSFMNAQLKLQPFHKERFDPLVGRLSTLYSIVRTGTAPAVSKARSIDSSQDEEEEELQMRLKQSHREHGYGSVKANKTAFWVHPDSLMDLKMLILKYLPLVVYEPTTALNSSHRSTSQLMGCLTSESPVSTIYLDNQDLDLYMGQVEHRDRTETVRLRWYGSERKQIWVEHQQRDKVPSSVSSSSGLVDAQQEQQDPIVTKHRFQIKSKNVPQLLQGSAKIDKILNQMRRSGQKTEEEIEQFKQSTERIQSRIHQQGLQPVIQTFFNRTAFQVPGDARVRITIDTDVVMVRERAVSKSSSPPSASAAEEEGGDFLERPATWTPTRDLKAEEYPFLELGEDDSEQIVRFPYAIMQIRTLTDVPRRKSDNDEEEDEEDEQIEAARQAMSWVDRIAQSHLVEMVPHFTKDQHAVATLYESRVGLLPFWLSDMDRDIRKPAMLTGREDSGSNSSQVSSSNDTIESSATSATTMSDTGGSPSVSGSGSTASSLSSSASNPLNFVNNMKGKGKGGLGELLKSSKSKQEQSKRRKSVLDNPFQFTPQHEASTSTSITSSSSQTGARTSPPPSVTFHEEVQDLVAVNRMMIQQQGDASLNSAFNKKHPHHPKKPVVSCLKKYGSQSSLSSPLSPMSPSMERGRASATSSGYGSASSSSQSSPVSENRRPRKKVTFKKSPARIWWDKCTAWVPVASLKSMLRLSNAEEEEDSMLPSYVGDLEQQSRRVLPRTLSVLSSTSVDSAYAAEQERKRLQQARRRRLARWFWTGLDGVNISLLFVGLVLALMNLGDGVGLEVASLFLVISCLCMGSTVWAHLIRMDSAHPDQEEGSSDINEGEISTPYKTADERTALLSGSHASQFDHAAHQGQWVRTRLMPTLMFMCLVVVVGLNAWVRSSTLVEDIGSD